MSSNDITDSDVLSIGTTSSSVKVRLHQILLSIGKGLVKKQKSSSHIYDRDEQDLLIGPIQLREKLQADCDIQLMSQDINLIMKYYAIDEQKSQISYNAFLGRCKNCKGVFQMKLSPIKNSLSANSKHYSLVTLPSTSMKMKSLRVSQTNNSIGFHSSKTQRILQDTIHLEENLQVKLASGYIRAIKQGKLHIIENCYASRLHSKELSILLSEIGVELNRSEMEFLENKFQINETAYLDFLKFKKYFTKLGYSQFSLYKDHQVQLKFKKKISQSRPSKLPNILSPMSMSISPDCCALGSNLDISLNSFDSINLSSSEIKQQYHQISKNFNSLFGFKLETHEEWICNDENSSPIRVKLLPLQL